MLEFQPYGRNGEKQNRTTQVRHGEKLAEMIERASRLLGVEKSAFVRAAIAGEAERTLKASSHHTLSEEDARLFAAALDAPPAPTPAAIRAAKDYERRVVHAE